MQIEPNHIGYIYKITNKLNNKVYVGKRQKPQFETWYWGSGVHISNAIKKYGKENFSREILEWCDSSEQLCEREKFWIKELDAKNSVAGYNISDGGDGVSLPGNLNGMYGKKASEESRQKMSMAHPKSYPPEFGAKISKSLKGHTFSKETREKISNANKGQKAWNKGQKNPYSKETTKKMSESAKKRGISPERHKKMIDTIVSHKYHWYSNGQESKKFRENEQPEGWQLGRKFYNVDRSKT